jgi:hypothetical protein
MKCIALRLMLTTVLAGCASSQVPAKPVSNLKWAVKIDYATPLFDVPRGLRATSDRPAARTAREVIEQASQAVCIVLVAP